MVRSAALILTIAASTFALGAFSRGPVESQVAAVIGGMAPVSSAHAEGAASRKGDRAEAARPAASLAQPATVAVAGVGVGAANVILRDGSGTILYRSDRVANTTLVAKDADLPSITVKQDRVAPVVQRPIAGADEGEKRLKVGCEGVVSPLVSHEARRRTGRCLT